MGQESENTEAEEYQAELQRHRSAEWIDMGRASDIKEELVRWPAIIVWIVTTAIVYFSGWWRSVPKDLLGIDTAKICLAIELAYFVASPTARRTFVELYVVGRGWQTVPESIQDISARETSNEQSRSFTSKRSNGQYSSAIAREIIRLPCLLVWYFAFSIAHHFAWWTSAEHGKALAILGAALFVTSPTARRLVVVLTGIGIILWLLPMLVHTRPSIPSNAAAKRVAVAGRHLVKNKPRKTRHGIAR